MPDLGPVFADFLEGRGKVRAAAEATLRAASPDDLLTQGLPLLAAVKPSRADRLRLCIDVTCAPEVREAAVLAALSTGCKRPNFWDYELPQIAKPVVGRPAIQDRAVALLLAPESKVPVLRRECAVILLEAAGTPLARRALITRARLDRHRRGYTVNLGDPPPGPKPASWRDRLVVVLSEGEQRDVLPTLLLEAAAEHVVVELTLWEGIARRLGDEALPLVERRFAPDPTYAPDVLRVIGSPTARAWLRGLTTNSNQYAQFHAALALFRLEGAPALPWVAGVVEARRGWGRDYFEKSAYEECLSLLQEHGTPPARIGLLDGESSPIPDRGAERTRRLPLPPDERARLEAEEAALILSAAEIPALP